MVNLESFARVAIDNLIYFAVGFTAGWAAVFATMGVLGWEYGTVGLPTEQVTVLAVVGLVVGKAAADFLGAPVAARVSGRERDSTETST